MGQTGRVFSSASQALAECPVEKTLGTSACPCDTSRLAAICLLLLKGQLARVADTIVPQRLGQLTEPKAMRRQEPRGLQEPQHLPASRRECLRPAKVAWLPQAGPLLLLLLKEPGDQMPFLMPTKQARKPTQDIQGLAELGRGQKALLVRIDTNGFFRN